MFSLLRRYLHVPPPRGFDELDDRLARVERDMRHIELEWESTYNKIRSILARLSKRDERDQPVGPRPATTGQSNGAEPALTEDHPAMRVHRGGGNY